jgi:hypothetical protein
MILLRALLCLILFFLVGIANAFANLGDNEEQIETLYGKPIGSAEMAWGPSRVYYSPSYFIGVVFEKGICRAEIFSRRDKQALSDLEIAVLLSAYSGWNPNPKQFDTNLIQWRGPNDLRAEYNVSAKALLISTQRFFDKRNSTPKPRASQN